MYSLKYQIKTNAQIIISSVFGNMNLITTEKYIPARSIIGIFAYKYLKKLKNKEKEAHQDNVLTKSNNKEKPAHEDDTFYRLFLSGNLIFSNAYFFSKDVFDYKTNKNGVLLYPVPFSIKNKKYSNNYYDRLFFDKELKFESLNGFFYMFDDELQLDEPETCLNFHHQRDRKTKAPKKNIIFNYESIAPDQIFEGYISGSLEDIEALKKIYNTSWNARIGRSKNVQYGHVKVKIFDDIKNINETIQNNSIKITNKNNKQQLTMTLLSDTICNNQYGFSSVDISNFKYYLSEKIGNTINIIDAYIKKARMENYIGVWNLKRPAQSCFKAGSTFLLETDHFNIETLIDLQNNGIGEYTHEGCGKCIFGLQKYGELSYANHTETIKKPHNNGAKLPEMARDILIKNVKNYFYKIVTLDSINDQKGFNNTVSASLIRRLELMAKQSFKQSLEKNDLKVSDIFKEKLLKLKLHAQNNLKKCTNSNLNINLYDFLNKLEIKQKDILNKKNNIILKNLCNEINFLNKEKFDNELYDQYIQNFLSALRKRE